MQFSDQFKKLSSVILLSASTLCPCVNTGGDHAKDPIRIHIDRKLWPQARAISWPGTSRSIAVQFNVHSGSQVCDKPLAPEAIEKLSRSDIVFGVACEELFVLMKRMPISFSVGELEVIAAHEAIHAATLSTTRKLRLDIAGANQEAQGAMREEANRFFLEVLSISREAQLDGGACARLQRSFDALRGPERAFVNDQINAEWPAEFFMRLHGSIVEDEQYAAFRRKISRGNDLEPSYMAGGIAMVRIDNVIGRESWQQRTHDGESLTGLLFESLGCRVPQSVDRQPLASVRGILPNLVLD